MLIFKGMNSNLWFPYVCRGKFVWNRQIVCIRAGSNLAQVVILRVRNLEVKTTPLQVWTGPYGSSRFRFPELLDSRYMKVESLSTLRTGCLYSEVDISGTHFCERLSRPQGHSAAGKFMSIKIFGDPIRIRTLKLQACKPVAEPTASPRTASLKATDSNLSRYGEYLDWGV
jgi:hypothetical protein